jgi:hypothetical protein
MHPVSRLLVVTASVLVACTELPTESTTRSPVVALNRIALNRIALNRIALNRLAANQLSAARLSTGQLSVNVDSAGKLLDTEDGREVLSLIVSCAMPPDIDLLATVDGVTFDFPGELGLTAGWLVNPLDSVGQGWVSACLYSRVNANEVVLPISMRGPNPSLAASTEERTNFPLEEGAFFGNFFTPLDQPLQMFACRGAAQAAGETGGLVDRDCAEPDPLNPGLTLCGFTFVGDCGAFDPVHACDQFSGAGTFYAQCRVSPKASAVFQQVITTYVTL